MDNSALIVVDVQNDFCPGGALGVFEGDRIIPVLNKWIGLFAKRGMPVVYTKDWHPGNHCSFIEQGGVWPAHCVQGTDGAAFHQDLDELGTHNVKAVFLKGFLPSVEAYSGFDGRLREDKNGLTLAQWLKSKNVVKLYVGGLATDYCVKATALDGLANGFSVKLIADGIRAVNVNPEDGKRAIDEMLRQGVEIAPQ